MGEDSDNILTSFWKKLSDGRLKKEYNPSLGFALLGPVVPAPDCKWGVFSLTTGSLIISGLLITTGVSKGRFWRRYLRTNEFLTYEKQFSLDNHINSSIRYKFFNGLYKLGEKYSFGCQIFGGLLALQSLNELPRLYWMTRPYDLWVKEARKAREQAKNDKLESISSWGGAKNVNYSTAQEYVSYMLSHDIRRLTRLVNLQIGKQQKPNEQRVIDNDNNNDSDSDNDNDNESKKINEQKIKGNEINTIKSLTSWLPKIPKYNNPSYPPGVIPLNPFELLKGFGLFRGEIDKETGLEIDNNDIWLGHDPWVEMEQITHCELHIIIETETEEDS